MKIREFSDLVRLTQDAGLKTSVWWRDDDVFDDTKELNRLLHFSEKHDVPVHLAVIPKHLTDDARVLIKSNRNITVLQHGYAHVNHAKNGAPLNEFSLDREIEVMLNEIRCGFTKLSEVFDEQFLPLFVPPWGHVALPVIERLHKIGFVGVSLIGDNIKNYPNLNNMNVHIDIHSWRTNSEISYDVIIKPFERIANDFIKIISTEKFRSNGYLNIGVLTHSQIMHENDWVIFKRFILALKEVGVEIIAGSRLHLGQH